MIRRTILVLLAVYALVPMSLSAQQTRLVVIELHTRTAEEVIPLLQPMLVRGGTISGLKDKLIIRTTPANLVELQNMLDVLDVRPRRLLITVKRDTGKSRNDREIEVSGSVGNDSVRVKVPGTTGSPDLPGSSGDAVAQDSQNQENRIQIRASAARSNASGQSLQTLQVNEGTAAFIGVGESVPIRERSAVGGAAGRETIGFQEAATGFYAIPRIKGDRVTVQLASSADTVLDRRSGAAHIQRITSVVSGRIGEWIEVGGVTELADAQHAEIASGRRSESHDQGRVYIKVEEIR